MTRGPLDIDDILDTKEDNQRAKPQFLSKLERQKLKEKRHRQQLEDKSTVSAPIIRPTKKRVPVSIDFGDDDAEQIIPKKNKKPRNGPKFAFEWSEEDDTSADFEPLVSLPKRKGELGFDDLENGNAAIHWSEKPLDQMTFRDWRILKDDYNILAKGGGDISNPLRNWDEAKLPLNLYDVLVKKLGYKEPTSIQRASIPVSLSGRDVVGVAETGSGKTLAFLIPLLNYILHIEDEYMKNEHSLEANHNQCLGLVLAPTRELAIQITQVATKFGSLLGLNVVQIIGGHTYEEQVHSVSKGVHIVVGTPGRVLDSIERGIIGLDKCYYVVMDEADRMIDMGFEKQVTAIMDKLPTTETLNKTVDKAIFRIDKRISLMFTATISPPIERMTKNYLNNPAYLFIGNANKVVDSITQDFYYNELPPTDDAYELQDSERFKKLVGVLRSHVNLCQRSRAIACFIIFANFKKTCEALSYELGNVGFKDTVVIHGSKSQDARERAIEEFRSQKARILIATDVAARGIDVPNVSLVVNYQMPNKFDEYIHRIGRTGRAGNQGYSFSFVDDSNAEILMPLKKFLTKGGVKCPKWLLNHQATQTKYLRE